MRKMKKINGYLVVKFNDRELREWEGTALGKYGVIDAELYTGTLEVDRGAMEYDNADSMEEAVELARGLESELDTEEPEVKVTIIKETDEATEEESVDARQMIAGWESTLRGKVESPHYTDVDERTAAHELYGYKVALRDLGLLAREDCYVLPDTFGEWPNPIPREPEEFLSYVCDELCQHRRPEMTQEDPLNGWRTRRMSGSSAHEEKPTGRFAGSSTTSAARSTATRLSGSARRPGPTSGRWRLFELSQIGNARSLPQPLRARSRHSRSRRSGRPSSTFTRISSGTGRRCRSTPWGWRCPRTARPTIAGSTSISSTQPGSWTPPWMTWTPTALRRSVSGVSSGSGSESWRRCSMETMLLSGIGRRRECERVRLP